MIYLFLSIVANTSIYYIFKWFSRDGIQVLPALVVNYFTAFLTGFMLIPDFGIASGHIHSMPYWCSGALVLGLFFIAVFWLTAVSTKKIGVTLTTVSGKMSLALSVILLTWLDPTEHGTALRIVIMVLSLAGLYFATLSSDGARLNPMSLKWAAVIFLGTAIVDTGIAHFSIYASGENEKALFSCLSFLTAGITGLIFVLVQVVRGRMNIRLMDIAGGLTLGVINYGTVFFLVKAYDVSWMKPSTLLPANNLGVVIGGVLLSAIFFGEKPGRVNLVGLALCMVALMLLLVS